MVSRLTIFSGRTWLRDKVLCFANEAAELEVRLDITNSIEIAVVKDPW